MELRQTVNAFVDAFNSDDLDAVMFFFSEHAHYHTVDGRAVHGHAAIRAEFSAQFAGTYGQLRFLLERIIVDELRDEAALAWTCVHHFADPPVPAGLQRLPRLLLRALLGRSASWAGVDILKFDTQGRIVAKHTYGKTRIPRLRKDRPADIRP